MKIRSLEVRNYKRLDALSIDFPAPEMPEDLDIIVLGSQNGGGKTSVLECIGLLFLATTFGEKLFHQAVLDREGFVDLADLLIRSGQTEAEINGTFALDSRMVAVRLLIRRLKGGEFSLEVKGDTGMREAMANRSGEQGGLFLAEMVANLLALGGEPVLSPPLLHFNSYRKVQEGNPDLAVMSDHFSPRDRLRFTRRGGRMSALSTFKMEMLRSIIGRAGLFEGTDRHTSEETVDLLNELLLRYAGGVIEKLRPLPDNTLDFRIRPQGEAASFAFDGLSSGQKEIVSTLFLIWRYSRRQGVEVPAIVLVDEPELHLNAEWHADLLEQLRKVGPDNQYILATHSEQVFHAVDADRRRLLVPNQ